MKEACSTRVPEDSSPPPSSPVSRKLPAAFPGAFLPILPRSRFFRRHQQGFLFLFFLPRVSPGRAEKRGALPGPARPGSAQLRQEGKPRREDGMQRWKEGSDLGCFLGWQNPAQEVCAQEVCARSELRLRCPEPGIRRSARRSQVGRGSPGSVRAPRPKNTGKRRKSGSRSLRSTCNADSA